MVKVKGSFQFKINWSTIRYLMVCAIAIGAMLFGSFMIGDKDVALLFAFAGYIIARVLLWIYYRE